MQPVFLLTSRLVYLSIAAILMAELVARLGLAPARFASYRRSAWLERTILSTSCSTRSRGMYQPSSSAGS